MSKYKMVQIPEDAHRVLKEYCKKNNKLMGKEVADIIYKITAKQNPEKLPTRILRVNE